MADLILQRRVLDVLLRALVSNSRTIGRSPPYYASFVTVLEMPPVGGPLGKQLTSYIASTRQWIKRQQLKAIHEAILQTALTPFCLVQR
jgi:hypothetical protein